jgi:hypothetical protein
MERRLMVVESWLTLREDGLSKDGSPGDLEEAWGLREEAILTKMRDTQAEMIIA